MINAYQFETITNAGATVSYNVETLGTGLILLASGGSVTLVADLTVNFTGTPAEGQQVVVGWSAGFDLNGNNFTINGSSVTDLEAISKGFFTFTYFSGAWGKLYSADLSETDILSGLVIKDETLTIAKIEDVTDGRVMAGNASNRPAALTVAGVLSAISSGATLVYSFVAGSITNAAINAAAAIARSKLANGTANYVLINSAGGVMTEEQRLATSRGGTGVDSSGATGVPRVTAGTWSFLSALTAALGGTGIDTSASTGFPTIAAGTWSVGSLTDSIVVPVSWESGEQCNNRVQFNFPCTITNIYAVVTRALANTDAGTIVPKDAGGTNMTLASALSFPLSSALETAIDTAVTANNAVAAGDEIYLTTAKATAGGKALVTITYTRTTRS